MTDWRHRAACRGEDPDLFFPVGNTGPAMLQIEDAKAVCRSCDVIEQCLQWALETGQDAGVWGGMSEDERRALKRRANRAGTRYGRDVQAAAVERFREIRGEHLSDWSASKAVAEEFGISQIKTVLAWTAVCSDAERGPGRKPDLELRAHAVELVAQLRPHHSSEKATHRAVALRLGVHESTVGDWVRMERANAAVHAAAAGTKES